MVQSRERLRFLCHREHANVMKVPRLNNIATYPTAIAGGGPST